MKYYLGVLFCLVAFVSVAIPDGVAAESGPGHGAKMMVKQLAAQKSVAGLTIQLAPENFTEQTLSVPLVFSSVLAEGLATALAEYGAKVSMQEQGELPYILRGSYLERAGAVEITLRLRRMGAEFSTDVATAGFSLPVSQVDPAWFVVGLEQIAASLITQVEQKYIRQGSPDIRLQPPVPGVKGQPTRKIGGSLHKKLELSLSRSQKLRSAFLSSHPTPYTLEPTYSLLDGWVSFNLRMRNEKGKVIAAGSVTRETGDFAGELLEQTAEGNITVCLGYKKSKEKHSAAQSEEAQMVLDSIEQALNTGNIEVIRCEESAEDKIRISTSLLLKAKSLRDDYGVVSATVKISVSDEKGTGIGRLSSTQNAPYREDPENGIEKVLAKIFTPAFQKKLTAILLSR